MIRGKARMENQIEQAGIIPALALPADIQHQFFARDIGNLVERVNPSFAFPNDQPSGSRHRSQSKCIGKKQMRKSRDRVPTAGDQRD